VGSDAAGAEFAVHLMVVTEGGPSAAPGGVDLDDVCRQGVSPVGVYVPAIAAAGIARAIEWVAV
jgi:hypothetical protein